MYSIEEINHVNPALNQILIKNNELDFQGVIYPNLGASLQRLSSHGIEIIDGITSSEEGLNTYKSKYNSSFLFPFPSRIPNGKYSFNNVDYQLECNEKIMNNAIHGHIDNEAFSLKQKKVTKNNAVVILSYANNGTTKGFPFLYQLEVTYIFTKEKLTIDFTVCNNGKTMFPFGIGWHPYFKSENLSDSSLDFEAEKQYLLNERLVPKGEIPINYGLPLLVKETFLDDCFIIKKSAVSFKTNEYDITLDFSSKSPNSFLQVYTPPSRNSIAIEPMTCIGNCFNNNIGLLILHPDNSYNFQVNLAYQLKN